MEVRFALTIERVFEMHKQHTVQFPLYKRLWFSIILSKVHVTHLPTRKKTTRNTGTKTEQPLFTSTTTAATTTEKQYNHSKSNHENEDYNSMGRSSYED